MDKSKQIIVLTCKILKAHEKIIALQRRIIRIQEKVIKKL